MKTESTVVEDVIKKAERVINRFDQLEAEINNLDLIEEPVVYCKAYNMDEPLIINMETRTKSKE